MPWELVPIALGVIASPIAVMALLGVLLSKDARRTGTAYLIGWTIAVVVSIVFWDLIFERLEVGAPLGTGLWVRGVHILLAIGFAVGAVLTYRRARTVLTRIAAAQTPDELAAATPQLPGMLRSATQFTPQRALVVGGGIFLLNPLNVSLVIAAALEIALSTVLPAQRAWLIMGFVVAAAAPVAVPVALVLARGAKATPVLERLRSWVMRNNGMVSAGLLLVVAVIQLGKGLDGVFGTL
ncbi:GAP family protein [Microbacterium murale]|uniref:Sap-like sulfolipid-1-addressing protein n=1 Tax=Microbacterium murale TaxID=1081040 RepID=A0ABQ1RVL6_9MICO|nr:GAP family protein [Microbacterium murale]GGD81632.1 hypothetical protein GCM10007269_25500 [Microbacterium murale]